MQADFQPAHKILGIVTQQPILLIYTRDYGLSNRCQKAHAYTRIG
jgi:hypothetical protein